jgi:hypothetical protein
MGSPEKVQTALVFPDKISTILRNRKKAFTGAASQKAVHLLFGSSATLDASPGGVKPSYS